MKKVTALFLLIVFLLAGGTMANAQYKITSKKTKAKTSKTSVKDKSADSSNILTASFFVKKGRYGFDYKNNIEKRLIDAGFKKVSYMKTFDGYNDEDGGTKRTYETKYSLTHNGEITSVIIRDDYYNDATEVTNRRVLIYLPNQSKITQFIKSIKSLGFKANPNNEWGITYEYPSGASGLSFRIQNNEICIFDMVA